MSVRNQPSVYQIYVKSFKDSNGDGIGDIEGIIQQLDYLAQLGVDYLWLTPIHPSPMRDNGYDVSHYREINPLFGTMESFERLIEQAAQRGLKIMLDMVFNHTSTEHEWFQKAIQGDLKYKDYYIFKDPVQGGVPTNWVSKFGGTAWEYVECLNQYYLHLFDVSQADLNWDNPHVRQELYDIVHFWAQKGVKGFRFDVINLVSKPEIFEDDFQGDGRRFYTDGPRIHEYLTELHQQSFGRYEGMLTVGEMSSTTLEAGRLYSHESRQELSMIFNFHHLKVDYDNGNKWSVMPFDFSKLKSLLYEWQEEVANKGGHMALFWSNHDQPRVVSRLGCDQQWRVESAKMLATVTYLMKGTPYIYQGEELGMTNAYFKKLDDYQDVESKNYAKILKEEGKSDEEILRILGSKSRDNARTPMQWSSAKNADFSQEAPWIKLNDNYTVINAKEAVENSDSVYHYFRQLLQLRKNLQAIHQGTFKRLPDTSQVMAYECVSHEERVVVLANFYGITTSYPWSVSKDQHVLLNNYLDHAPMKGFLRPYEVVVLAEKIRK